jgi:hypothetical protein
LRPILAHGYSDEVVARIPPIARSAPNAAAAAYRTGAIQIVTARAGSSERSALVVPVISSGGCIGALSVEMGSAASPPAATQALASILAAQLSGILAASAPVTAQERAAGAG